ncbi:MAG: hypothetical protein SVV03_01950, partial [Candidatus Nanohaloarchaea archaeon]|nr:hypothetical protein [Candidatus Nanohaloarchaea archaeon]
EREVEIEIESEEVDTPAKVRRLAKRLTIKLENAGGVYEISVRAGKEDGEGVARSKVEAGSLNSRQKAIVENLKRSARRRVRSSASRDAEIEIRIKVESREEQEKREKKEKEKERREKKEKKEREKEE